MLSSPHTDIQLQTDTLIGVPFDERHALHSLLQDGFDTSQTTGTDDISRRLFQIRMADSAGKRSDASILINRMYATRGYRCNGLPEAESSRRITLVASEFDEAIGTISIGFDSPSGLLVDSLFGDETAALRRSGQRLCEFTKLAIDSVVRSRRVLASLFHVAYIYSYRVLGGTHLLIEVNPRHVNYYRRMLGFQVIGPERLNHRVNAPAVLMGLDFEHARDQIAKFGGCPEAAAAERSLYPFFFSPQDERGIVDRIVDARPKGAPMHRFSRTPAAALHASALHASALN